MKTSKMALIKSRGAYGKFRKGKYDVAMVMLAVLLPFVVIEALMTSSIANLVGFSGMKSDTMSSGRHLLQAATPLNCTPRSIHQFPDDFMTEEQRKHGGVVFHIFISLYLFVATAIACDDFFVPALEKICEVWQVQTDVAGATFMAAGSSAPEFFAAVIGIFFAKSDIGLSTIVGSAVFNLLLVNAVVGLFSGMVIYLTWWPVFRDCTYYAFSVVVLIIVMVDERVHWYESLIMVLLYILYVVLMYFNRRVGNYLMNNVDIFLDNRPNIKNSDTFPQNEAKRPLLADQTLSPADVTSNDVEKAKDGAGMYGSIENAQPESESGPNVVHLEVSISDKSSVGSSGEFESVLKRPEGCFRTFLWVIMLPASFLMVITTPDFRRGGCWEKLYSLTFFVSILWIAGLCYVMVWMVTIAGDTLGIPDTVMGLTLLAVGTSVPDAIASLLVAKDGYGDMAVSNSIGSNVFDILLCLGLPWLIQTGMIAPNSVIIINSKGLTYSTIILLITILFLFIGLLVNKWKLNKAFGVACLIAYVVVVGISCLLELNVFGEFNLPPCPW